MSFTVTRLVPSLAAATLLVLSWSTAAAAQTFGSERHEFRLITVAEGLAHPWSLAFLPGGDILVTERPGRLRILRDGDLDPTPVPGTPEVAAVGQGGLLDIALHPKFAETGWIYLTYAGRGSGGLATELARARWDDGRLVDLERLLVATPRAGGGRHFGSRLAFGADGYLYMTVGERGSPERAQDLGDLAGSVLRLTESGGVPPDNPFVGRDGARPEIFTYGHRNPQGLMRHPQSGAIWAVEHGPLGGDELNVIEAGTNYGWPVITYGRSYAGFPIGEGESKPGMAQPVHYWVPSISPSGVTVYDGTAFPDWRGSLFLGALSGRALVRLELEGRNVVHEERLLEDLGVRVRDVRQGPEGRLYLLTDAPNGSVLRLEPVE